ncbi:hypothetical protein E2542_SST03054 [Spatholobus suberectus]|nr:hypothetical protein E2542_SST03054 [Spatholobus suberectus]
MKGAWRGAGAGFGVFMGALRGGEMDSTLAVGWVRFVAVGWVGVPVLTGRYGRRIGIDSASCLFHFTVACRHDHLISHALHSISATMDQIKMQRIQYSVLGSFRLKGKELFDKFERVMSFARVRVNVNQHGSHFTCLSDLLNLFYVRM